MSAEEARYQKPHVGWGPIDQKYDGNTIVCYPTSDDFSRMQVVVDRIDKFFVDHGITTFTPTPQASSHISLFTGINANISAEERKYIIEQVAERIAHLNPMKIMVQFDNKKVSIEISPPKEEAGGNKKAYTVLKFPSPDLQKLNDLVADVIRNGIAEKHISPEHIDLVKLEKRSPTHITLGRLKGENQQAVEEDKKKLRDTEIKQKFKQTVQQALKVKQYSFMLSIHAISLVGVERSDQDSNFHTLATINFKEHALSP